MYFLSQEVIFYILFLHQYLPSCYLADVDALLHLLSRQLSVGRQNSEKPFSGLFITVIHVFSISMFYCQI